VDAGFDLPADLERGPIAGEDLALFIHAVVIGDEPASRRLQQAAGLANCANGSTSQNSRISSSESSDVVHAV